MRKAIVLWLLCGSLWGQCADGRDRTLRFAGEVARDQTFRKDIGRGLDFVLTPLKEPPSGGLTGWTIQVSPHGRPPAPECTDFLWVVTPPYRFWNHRYLSTEYGNTAQEAVAMSPREFNFVLNCEDYRIERQRVGQVLWPSSQQELEKALTKLGLLPQGTGRLWIKDSKYTPGEKSTDPAKIGAIHWIKFDVEINFPEGLPRNSKP